MSAAQPRNLRKSSERASRNAPPPHAQPTSPRLDGTDRAILAELVADGRITNSTLAHRVGVAESTCINRVRTLRENGVITGVHAHLDPAALALPMQAVIKVRLGSHNREHVHAFHDTLQDVPGVLTAFHLAGADDYLLHVAVRSAEALRDLVLEHITVHPAVRHAETHLVFEVIPGAGPLPIPPRNPEEP